jgi:hydrogenase maturation protein HypF
MQNIPDRATFQSRTLPTVNPEPRMTVEPDRAICPACAEEVLNPARRRFRYPFAHCSHCGPQFSVMRRLPFEHANTAFAQFDRCLACDAEYYDPTNRHFRTETAVCPHCGPRATLIRFDGGPIPLEQYSALDDVDAACTLIQKGEVVAIKGLGGWQLACDATNEGAIARLRRAKQNSTKPLPLMARDLHIIARYAAISVEEEFQLTSAQNPIVILRATGARRLPGDVAPGLATLGFMLPTTALHLLLMQRMSRPVVMTSANLSGKPQIIDDEEAFQTLGVTIRYALTNNYRIANRVEDSVVRVIRGKPRLLRRARGYAPAALKLPGGFERASDIVAIGGDRRGAFCLMKQGVAIPAPHYADISDLEECKTYQGVICQFRSRLAHKVSMLAIDTRDDYLSANMARIYAAQWKLGLIEVEHHHAHIASCLAENGYPIDAPPVLGIVLDRVGWDEEDRSGIRGEFILADYHGCARAGGLKPIPLPDVSTSRYESWRDLCAHLDAAMGWQTFTAVYGGLDLCRNLQDKSGGVFSASLPKGRFRHISSCGRLFNAVAAALSIGEECQSYDGETAMRLEAVVDDGAMSDAADALYPVALQKPGPRQMPLIDPAAMWHAMLSDLTRKTPAAVIAARFHYWLAASIAAMVNALARTGGGETASFATVALSGGCFQNKILLEETERLLRQGSYAVLTHAQVPPHSGGLSLGQVAIGAAQLLGEGRVRL